MAGGRGSKTFSVTTDLSAFVDLMQEVVDASHDAVVPAAAAGSELIYQATLQATPHGKKGHWFTGSEGGKGRYWFPAGTLRASIYQVLSEDNTGPGYATFHISWNYKKAPYAFMVHNGHRKRGVSKENYESERDPITGIHNGTSKAAAVPFVTIGRERSAVPAQEAMAAKYLEILTGRGLLS